LSDSGGAFRLLLCSFRLAARSLQLASRRSNRPSLRGTTCTGPATTAT